MKTLEEVMAKLSEPADFARPSDRFQGRSYLAADDVVKDLHEITDGCYSTHINEAPKIAPLPEGDNNAMFSGVLILTIKCTDGEITRTGVGATPYRYQGQGFKDNPTGIIKRAAANAFMNACKTFPRYKNAELDEDLVTTQSATTATSGAEIPVCQTCGTKIPDAPNIGQTAAQIAASRKKKYGVVVCTNCMKALPGYTPYDPNRKKQDAFANVP